MAGLDGVEAEIVLVRHGQASFGTDDYDRLSPLGHEQAGWLGRWMAAHEGAFDRVAHGTLRRHRETFAGLADGFATPAPQVDPRLDELHFDSLAEQYIVATGSDAPQSRPEFLRLFPRMFAMWARGEIHSDGEAYGAFLDRTAAVVEEAAFTGGRTLFVTSGGVIGVTMARVLGLDPDATANLLVNIHNASLHRLIREDGRLRLGLFNASPHLDPEERRHARTYI